MASMELGNLEETRGAFVDAKNAESAQEQGGDVVLLLNVPQRGEQRHSFKMGATVAYVKLVVEQEYGLPMATVVLKANGKALMDPLSLSDCPGFAPGQVVNVEVTTV
jgi:hypothetical protein